LLRLSFAGSSFIKPYEVLGCNLHAMKFRVGAAILPIFGFETRF
jgi:hypothetical protein